MQDPIGSSAIVVDESHDLPRICVPAAAVDQIIVSFGTVSYGKIVVTLRLAKNPFGIDELTQMGERHNIWYKLPLIGENMVVGLDPD